jgi:hypothetical protein
VLPTVRFGQSEDRRDDEYAAGVTTDRVHIGVGLPQPSEDLALWLREAAALDAAGADALWVDLRGVPDLDPVALTAALSTVTARALIVATFPEPATAIVSETIGRLSRGRLRTVSDPGKDSDGDFELDDASRWAMTAFPDDRAAWRTTLDEAAANGIGGLIVPADPRLLDLLRNPDDHGDRRDLQLAVG